MIAVVTLAWIQLYVREFPFSFYFYHCKTVSPVEYFTASLCNNWARLKNPSFVCKCFVLIQTIKLKKDVQ